MSDIGVLNVNAEMLYALDKEPTAYYYRTDYLTKSTIKIINFGLNVYFGNVYNYWVCPSSALVRPPLILYIRQ